MHSSADFAVLNLTAITPRGLPEYKKDVSAFRERERGTHKNTRTSSRTLEDGDFVDLAAFGLDFFGEITLQLTLKESINREQRNQTGREVALMSA